MLAGFSPALKTGRTTHREGNQLDQLWTRNVTILKAIVADPIDQVSDHNLIQVKLEASLIERGQTPQEDLGEVDLRTLPQSAIRKVIQECVKQGLFEDTPDIHKVPLLSQVPDHIAELFRP